ncbi:MAG TPA: hypothetical protein VIJ62_14900 [Rhizomicrobium sp.]
MSELINTHHSRATIRWKLLAGVSSLALTVYVSAASMVRAEDADHPLLWIELGGQAAWNENSQEAFLSPFTPAVPTPFEIISLAAVEKPARASWDENAAISFQPADSKWVFSAGVRYGRSGRHQFLSQRTETPDTPTGVLVAYQNITASTSESHAILDFSAGRDVGVGMGISSFVNLGVRYVQFSASRNTFIQSQPTNVGFPYTYHRINAHLVAARKFSGVGPSLSWDASARLAGDRDNGEIGIDWGVNAALLFGRQSARGHHQTTNVLYYTFYPRRSYDNSVPISRGKQITVPNVGGFAGVSWRVPNAKVSVGYRADFFFGAMDGGIDTARKENVGFYGPFASVSVGLGG